MVSTTHELLFTASIKEDSDFVCYWVQRGRGGSCQTEPNKRNNFPQVSKTFTRGKERNRGKETRGLRNLQPGEQDGCTSREEGKAVRPTRETPKGLQTPTEW